MAPRSAEAVERARIRRNAKKKANRAAAKKAANAAIKRDLTLPAHKISARRMMARLPANMSKADLREMLATAFRNTAAL